ncbi:MAG: ABC transporter substrate-binding protein [Tractidigestivibacter sp.]|uniref:ABC transporter substrate-binding protein n=1 Tax=Tractidigestivibacter sp. TaxID=2847320 RepID=UPI003D8AF1FA
MSDFSKNSLSRRCFVRGSLGTAIAMASAGILAGCSSDSGDTSSTEEAKVLRFGCSNPKVTFDTQKTSNDVGVSEAVAESLVALDPDTKEIYPVLLTELPTVSDDGLVYTFELKDGVKFHNGETLKASDVKYTFTRMFLPETEATSIDSYMYIEGAQEIIDGTSTELTGIEVTDDTHFTITLTQPYSTFLAMLAQFYAVIYPESACSEAGSEWGTGTSFIGTGPFTLESNDDSTEVVLKAFDDYHEGRPELDEVDFDYIDDANTRMLSYKNDDIDLAFIDRSIISTYAEDEDVKDDIVYYTPGSCQFVNLNLTSDNLKDVRVREALSLAINREELCSTVLNGCGDPCTSFLPPSCTGHDDSLEVLEYDPDRAKELLEEAGVSDLTLDFQIRSQDQNVAVALQNYWSQIGVTANVTVIDNGMWSDSRRDGGLEITTVTWSTLSFQGVEHMGSYFRSDRASAKSSFYDSETFDGLIDAARQTVNDDDQVIVLTKQADNQLVRTDWACIPIDWPQMPYALKPKFSGLKVLVNPHFGDVTVNEDSES